MSAKPSYFFANTAEGREAIAFGAINGNPTNFYTDTNVVTTDDQTAVAENGGHILALNHNGVFYDFNTVKIAGIHTKNAHIVGADYVDARNAGMASVSAFMTVGIDGNATFLGSADMHSAYALTARLYTLGAGWEGNHEGIAYWTNYYNEKLAEFQNQGFDNPEAYALQELAREHTIAVERDQTLTNEQFVHRLVENFADPARIDEVTGIWTNALNARVIQVGDSTEARAQILRELVNDASVAEVLSQNVRETPLYINGPNSGTSVVVDGTVNDFYGAGSLNGGDNFDVSATGHAYINTAQGDAVFNIRGAESAHLEASGEVIAWINTQNGAYVNFVNLNGRNVVTVEAGSLTGHIGSGTVFLAQDGSADNIIVSGNSVFNSQDMPPVPGINDKPMEINNFDVNDTLHAIIDYGKLISFEAWSASNAAGIDTNGDGANDLLIHFTEAGYNKFANAIGIAGSDYSEMDNIYWGDVEAALVGVSTPAASSYDYTM